MNSFENLDYSFFYFNKTLNHNFLVKKLNYWILKENYNNLPDTLKRITDKMTENDNNILQVVKFK